MDMGFSPDPVESFKEFQEKIYDEYLLMADEFGFIPVDASRDPNVQHKGIRTIIQREIDLPRFRWKVAP